ncbi:hypothetical protein A5722_32330 [Mycobacterium vulneris]|nr:hypothetical protein A5722_32330 [Mycolicibacterium vulneris]
MSDQFLVDFGATVRRLRDSRSMTQADLAERVGLGRTSMTNLERGNQNPPLSVLPLLAHGLGISLSELIAEVESSRRSPDKDVLATHVHDDALRSWASKLITRDSIKPAEQQALPSENESQ